MGGMVPLEPFCEGQIQEVLWIRARAEEEVDPLRWFMVQHFLPLHGGGMWGAC